MNEEKPEPRTATIKHTPFVELADGILAEQAYDGDDVYYLVYDPTTEALTKCDSVAVESTTYYPVDNDFVRNRQVILPSEANDFENEGKLFDEVKSFIAYWYEELDDAHLAIDALYIFLTYVADLLPNIPYLRKYGKFGGGKSTGLKVIGELCHRAFKIAGCSTEASLRRIMDLWRGTAIIDEADFSRSDLYALITKILNIGYDARLGWYTCCDEEDPTKTLSFYVYGPKVLATRERWKDNALESRCVSAQSIQNHSAKPLFQAERFTEQQQHLVNKLQMWRFKNYAKFKEQLETLEDPEIEKKTFGRAFSVASRIKQVMIPLALVIQDESVKNTVQSLMIAQDTTMRSLDEEALLEDELRGALRDLLLTRIGDSAELTKLAQLTNCDKPLPFMIRQITQRILGEDDGDRAAVNLTSRKVTKYLRDRVGLTIRVGTGNTRFADFPVPKLLHFLRVAPSSRTLTTFTSLTEDNWRSIQQDLKRQTDIEEKRQSNNTQSETQEAGSHEPKLTLNYEGSIGPCLQVLRKIPGQFTDGHAVDMLVRRFGLQRTTAEYWVEHLINDGLLMRDPENYLKPVK